MDYAATFCVVTSEELYHHGILGMKWGRRNGPPYPLGSGDHSASERRAGWRKSLAPGSPTKRGGGGDGGSDKPQAKVKTKKPDVKKETHTKIETDKKEDNKKEDKKTEDKKEEPKKEKKDKEGLVEKHKKNLYKALNNRLVFRDDAATKKFYAALKEAGYDGLRDANDRFTSGYKAKNPLIVFNNGKTFVDKVRALDSAEILTTADKVRDQMADEAIRNANAKTLGKFYGIVAGSGAATGLVGNEITKAQARAKGKIYKQNSARAKAAARTRKQKVTYHPYLNKKKKG